MSRLRVLLFVLLTIQVAPTLAADIPTGEVTKYTYDKSKVFPGTTRDYWIYVPKQYDPAKPACLYVNQDGIQYNAPKIFDELIASGEMPITIGVFVTPGRVKAPNDKAIDRFNRSYEYDGLGDAYARFLIDELLPEVETKQSADGRAIKVSKNGNDCAIGGASSGAVAAFTVAWERPDRFRRVFSAIGTYVGLRGGNVYPTLIRKYEPKPLRVFLQDGSNDLNIYGGDWWMANQEMERALVFAGYEVEHNWGTGGHSGEHATKIFADSMRWLWKGYPELIKTGGGSSPLKEILVPGESWQLVSEGYKFTEGPIANSKGEVFFNDIPNNTTYKIDLDGKVTPWSKDSKQGNGLAFGPDGALYSAAPGADGVLVFDAAGKVSSVATGIASNDLVVLHNGSIYVTHPGNGGIKSRVWHISPKGEKKVVDEGLKFANGITVSPDQTLLYVADSGSHWVYSYQIQTDGSLSYKQKYYHLHVPDSADESGADGIKTDLDGRLYVTTKMGLQVCDQAGRVNCIIPTPNGRVANLCFGGADFKTIYATCGDKVYKRKVKVAGSRPELQPKKPAAPRL